MCILSFDTNTTCRTTPQVINKQLVLTDSGIQVCLSLMVTEKGIEVVGEGS